MAKTISDEKLKLQVIIDSNPAQQELYKLEKATRSLTEENKGLLLQKKLLEKQGKIETEQYKLVTKSIKDNTKEIRSNKDRMNELQKEIGITGLTMNQLTNRANILKLSLRNTIPGSEAHRRYTQELSQITSRINELSGRAANARSAIGSIADGFNRYAALGASILAVITGVVVSIQKAVDWNGKLSDAQANVMKTTGMTKREVDDLTKSFGLLQTRTKRIDLLGIAEVGGRLGIAKEEINDFVKVMDRASVALGDSFEGGPEEVADKLGKIKGLYEELKNTGVEVAFNAVGSSINELGADGTATEANLAAFATRVGSLPDVLKPSIAQALGLGAAFEESGLKAELAGNNYGKVISIASRDFPQFAKVMGVSEKKVKDLLNTDPTEFFLQFANSLKGLDATQLSQVLDYLKLNDNEVKMVLGAASQNIDLFREKIDLAGKSLNEGTSLTNEFNIKNTNLAATLEKLQKRIIGIFSSETIVNWLASATEWFAKLIGATVDSDNTTGKWKNTLVFAAKIIAIVTAALITNVAWQKLVVLWTTRNNEATVLYNIGQKTRAFLTGVTTIATHAQALAVAIATRNTIAAKEAQIALGLAMKTTPWGFILSAIAAIATAYVMFTDRIDQAEKVQKTLAEVHLEATKSIHKQVAEVERLTKAVKDHELPEETRQKALRRLNELIDDNIGLLTMENIETMKGTDILRKYTDQLYAVARAKAVEARINKLYDERLDVEEKSYGDESFKGTNFLWHEEIKRFFSSSDWKKKMDTVKNEKDLEKIANEIVNKQISSGGFKPSGPQAKKAQEDFVLRNLKADFQEYIDRKNEALADIDAQINALKPEYEKDEIDKLSNGDNPTGETWVPSGDEGKKKKKYDDSYLEAERRAREEAFQAFLKSEEDKINLMEEGYAKQLALEQLNSTRKIHDLEMTNESIKLLQNKLNTDLIQAQKDGDNKKVASIRNQQALLLEKQVEINDQICYEEELTKLRIGIIQEKAADEHLKKEDENYKQAKVLRETKFNEELAALGNDEKAKQLLRKQFADEELKNEEEFLRVLIDRLNKIAGKGNFTGFDLSLLTPEQVEEFTKEAQKVGLTLAELIAKKNELSGQGIKGNLKALGLGGETDILGFTPENWEQFLSNLQKGKFGIEEMLFSVQALTNLWGQYAAYLTANENAQLKKFEKTSDAKKEKLKRQLDSGYISQNQYNKSIEHIDRELDKKKAQLEYKQAKRQRAINLANAVAGTAVAVINALQTQPVWVGLVMAGLVGIMGALQIATIMKTPLPAKGYEKGLYPEYVNVTREQDGKKYRPRYAGKLKSGLVSQNSLMVAEGNKPEMVIDNKAWSKISPEVQEALIREIRGVKGFENGYYKAGSLYSGLSTDPKPNPSDAPPDYGAMMQMMINVVAENTAAIKEFKETPMEAIVSSRKMSNIKELKEGFDTYDDLKNKQKK